MMALGLVFPWYLMNYVIVEGSFYMYLSIIKFVFCVTCKTSKRIMGSCLLFKFIMSQNAEGVIVEHSNLNPMSTLWKRIQSFVILSHKLNK
jgi:hypothetical protein